jgi:similar to stage IV sporulation protein
MLPWRRVVRLGGSLEVRARGRDLERFVNLLLDAGIPLWDLRRGSDGLHLRMDVAGFRRVRPAARRTHTRLRILGRSGIPFVAARAMRRRGLLAGALAAALAIQALVSFVWVVRVDVRGPGQVARWQVVAAAERLGLRPGVPRASVDPARLAADLPLLVPGVAWASVRLHGTQATIEVVGRRALQPDEVPRTGPAEVVAARDGVVTRLLVLAGEAAVRPGQTVRAGQVLIRDLVVPRVSGAPGAAAGAGRPVSDARGWVFARVWYDTYVEVSLHQTVAVPAGRVFVRRRLFLFGRWWDLSGWGRIPFAAYTVERSRGGPPEGRLGPVPLEWETVRYVQVNRYSRYLSQEAAVEEARSLGLRQITRLTPPGARVVAEEARVVQRTAGRLGVLVAVESEEQIGVERPVAAAR